MDNAETAMSGEIVKAQVFISGTKVGKSLHSVIWIAEKAEHCSTMVELQRTLLLKNKTVSEVYTQLITKRTHQIWAVMQGFRAVTITIEF